MLNLIDVSMYQGAVNWRRVRASGLELVYLKATQGAAWTDPAFARNRAAAAAAGLRVGAYAFVEPDGASPEAQAAHFANVVGALGRRELRPVQDLETGNPRVTEAFARAFTQALVRELGVTPLLYSYSAYLAGMRLARPIGGGLWLASYGRNDGTDHGATVPRPWRSWVAHQYSSAGSIAGIPGRVDLSHAPRLRPLLAHPITGLT
jgi:lysozyme